MTYRTSCPPICPIHGKPKNRRRCATCNAAYMRGYLRQRRLFAPGLELWERARRRARRLDVPFALKREAIVIPKRCPVLGIPLISGGRRSQNSPSLDRIRPACGYIAGNIRVVSDRANRIKGAHSLAKLTELSRSGPARLRDDYTKTAAYVDREALLAEVWIKASLPGRVGEEWTKIANFLDQAFRHGLPTDG